MFIYNTPTLEIFPTYSYKDIGCTLRSWVHEILFMIFSSRLEDNDALKWVPTIFHNDLISQALCKIVRTTYQCKNQNLKKCYQPLWRRRTIKKYWCYYPHRSRDSLSPICWSFSEVLTVWHHICWCNIVFDNILMEFIIIYFFTTSLFFFSFFSLTFSTTKKLFYTCSLHLFPHYICHSSSVFCTKVFYPESLVSGRRKNFKSLTGG